MSAIIKCISVACLLMSIGVAGCTKEEAPINIIDEDYNDDKKENIDNSEPVDIVKMLFQLSGDYAQYVPVRLHPGGYNSPGPNNPDLWVLDDGYYYSPWGWGATEQDSYINLTWEEYRNNEFLISYRYNDIIPEAKVIRTVFLPDNFEEIAMKRHPEFLDGKISYDDALKETMNWLIAEGLPDCKVEDIN